MICTRIASNVSASKTPLSLEQRLDQLGLSAPHLLPWLEDFEKRMKEMREAIDAYHADKNKWPPSLDALVTEKYIREVPRDPITSAVDWQTTPSEPDPSNPLDEPGISDVHSAASGASPHTQTPYSEW